mgnify:CR=1 FL=1
MDLDIKDQPSIRRREHRGKSDIPHPYTIRHQEIHADPVARNVRTRHATLRNDLIVVMSQDFDECIHSQLGFLPAPLVSEGSIFSPEPTPHRLEIPSVGHL